MQHTTLTALPHSKRVLITIGSVALASALALGSFTPEAYAVTAAEKQAEAEEALANLTAMQGTLDRLSAEYGEAVMAQEDAEEKADAAEKRIGEIQGELTELQGYLGERARELYRAGGVPFLDMVLGASTFEEFATSVDLVSKVNQSNADMIDKERNLKKEAEEQATILDEQAALAAEKAGEAEEAAAQAQATVAEMQSTYENLSAEAEQLLEEERKAREEEERARAAAVLAAAQAAAEEEKRARAAAEAEQQAQEQEEVQQQEEDQQNESGEESDTGEGAEAEDEQPEDESAEQVDEGSGEEESSEDSGSYEGGTDTVSRAYACLGAPYVWGGVGPDGYDCSGLVSYCLTGVHERLGTTYTFMGWTPVSDPQPGDIAVNYEHTGIYIGDGQMIHAATYGVGVIVGPVQSGMIFVRY